MEAVHHLMVNIKWPFIPSQMRCMELGMLRAVEQKEKKLIMKRVFFARGLRGIRNYFVLETG